MIHLATGLTTNRDGRILLVASIYANHPEPLWNLPGGRQRPGELLEATVVREIYEETGLGARAGELAYVSESYDGDEHILNVTFRVELLGRDQATVPAHRGESDHVVDVAWVPVEELGARIAVRVIRDPLLAYLDAAPRRGYFGFPDAGITIRWPNEST